MGSLPTVGTCFRSVAAPYFMGTVGSGFESRPVTKLRVAQGSERLNINGAAGDTLKQTPWGVEAIHQVTYTVIEKLLPNT